MDQEHPHSKLESPLSLQQDVLKLGSCLHIPLPQPCSLLTSRSPQIWGLSSAPRAGLGVLFMSPRVPSMPPEDPGVLADRMLSSSVQG